MRKCYTLLVLLFTFIGSTHADNYFQGYIITKSNIQLTGFIGLVTHSNYGSQVEFVNDFGTSYSLHPALIKGFVFQGAGGSVLYESKYWRRQWIFLRVLYPGENMRLYQAPEDRIEYRREGAFISTQTLRIEEYWIEVPGRVLFPVRRLSFRKKLRRIVAEVSPQLSEQIGAEGYRYRDLDRIVKEYDKACSKGKRRL